MEDEQVYVHAGQEVINLTPWQAWTSSPLESQKHQHQREEEVERVARFRAWGHVGPH